jgi:hypothetical protein
MNRSIATENPAKLTAPMPIVASPPAATALKCLFLLQIDTNSNKIKGGDI